MKGSNSSVGFSNGKLMAVGGKKKKPSLLSFKNRKNCIFKKAMELSVLCDVKVCALVSGPNGEIETWPENRDQVHQVIDFYNKKKKKKNQESLSETKKRKQRDSTTVSIKNKKMKFQDEDDIEEHRVLIGAIDAKLMQVKNRIDQLLKEKSVSLSLSSSNPSSHVSADCNSVDQGQMNSHTVESFLGSDDGSWLSFLLQDSANNLSNVASVHESEMQNHTCFDDLLFDDMGRGELEISLLNEKSSSNDSNHSSSISADYSVYNGIDQGCMINSHTAPSFLNSGDTDHLLSLLRQDSDVHQTEILTNDNLKNVATYESEKQNHICLDDLLFDMGRGQGGISLPLQDFDAHHTEIFTDNNIVATYESEKKNNICLDNLLFDMGREVGQVSLPQQDFDVHQTEIFTNLHNVATYESEKQNHICLNDLMFDMGREEGEISLPLQDFDNQQHYLNSCNYDLNQQGSTSNYNNYDLQQLPLFPETMNDGFAHCDMYYQAEEEQVLLPFSFGDPSFDRVITQPLLKFPDFNLDQSCMFTNFY